MQRNIAAECSSGAGPLIVQFLFELQGPQARADLWWPNQFFPFRPLVDISNRGTPPRKKPPDNERTKRGGGGEGS